MLLSGHLLCSIAISSEITRNTFDRKYLKDDNTNFVNKDEKTCNYGKEVCVIEILSVEKKPPGKL